MKIKFTLPIIAGTIMASSCNPTVQSTPSADFIISSRSIGENSIAAMPPADNTHGGTIALNYGVDWFATTDFCAFKNIYAGGAINNANAIIAGFTANSTPGKIDSAKDSLSSSTDNQMVRMDDGSLLLEKNCSYWKRNAAIKWLKDPMDSHQRGDRSANVFWRSTDSGKSWRQYSVLDPVNFDSGLYAVPKQDTGKIVIFHHGGTDRPQMYFCPFKKRVYLTSHYGGGAEPATPFLFYSDNHAKTWNKVGILTGNVPQMMTSTGDGRLFSVAYWHAHDGVALTYTKEVDGKPVLKGPFNVGYMINGKMITSVADHKAFATKSNTTQLAVSRVTVDPTQVYDVIRIAYMIGNSDGTTEYPVIDVFVNKETDSIFTVPLTIIKAADPVNYHVTFGTFIDPDFMELPAASGENTSVFYWIEQSIPGIPTHVMAKYCVFTDGLDYTAPEYLSLTPSNQPRNWTSDWPFQQGDYLNGGFFWNNSNMLNYLCDWNEPNGIHGNIVSVKSDYTALKFVKSGVVVSDYPAVNWNDLKPKATK